MKLFIRKLLRPGVSGEQRAACARVREAVDSWVRRQGYRKPLTTVEQIAADIGVHPEDLTVYVRMISGLSLLSWRKQLRIADAKVLLADYPELPVSMVARMVGIDDKSNFRKQFTEETGVSPREWRRRLK